jgi:hypothetical protein
MQLTERGRSFNLCHDEPDIYTLEDGEPLYYKVVHNFIPNWLLDTNIIS